MNRPYRISLGTHWTAAGQIDPQVPNDMKIRCVRSFNQPTGVSNSQDIFFCFQPAYTYFRFLFNDTEIPLTIIKGLATVSITAMMKPKNRAELCWHGDPSETPQLPEHFEAWLEISDEIHLDDLPDT